jgi:hypothetical protein
MSKVILGNHMATFAARSEQDKIRKFYCDVLGGKAVVTNDTVDRFQLGDTHFCYLYQDTAADEGGFLKSTYLELKSDNVEHMREKIVAFGVNKLDVPDPHLYFQAPGGQVFRLVGIGEDLSMYEQSESENPALDRGGGPGARMRGPDPQGRGCQSATLPPRPESG